MNENELKEWYRRLHERPEFKEEAEKQRKRIEQEMLKKPKDRWKINGKNGT